MKLASPPASLINLRGEYPHVLSNSEEDLKKEDKTKKKKKEKKESFFKLTNEESNKIREAAFSELYLDDEGIIKGGVPLSQWANWIPSGERDKIVIPETEIDITFDYPFSQTFTEHFRSAEGFRLSKLTEIIGSQYEEIYEDPEKYSVYDYELSDLSLTGIEKESEGLYTLKITS